MITADIVRSPDHGFQVIGATYLSAPRPAEATVETTGVQIYRADRPIAARMDADTGVISSTDFASREWMRGLEP